MADDSQLSSEEELREALDAIGVSDILLNALSAVASIGFRRVSAEARDLDEVRLAIEALRALDPVLREGGVDEAVVRDLEQARDEPPARLRERRRPAGQRLIVGRTGCL